MATVDETKRRAFARHFALNGNATAAAKAAGVPENSAHSMGYRWLRNESVVGMVREELDTLLRELAPLSIGVLRGLMEDEKASAATRLAAARDVMDRLGWVPPKRSEMKVDVTKKDLLDLTREELEILAAGGSVRDVDISD